jgi:hypothetical protein
MKMAQNNLVLKAGRLSKAGTYDELWESWGLCAQVPKAGPTIYLMDTQKRKPDGYRADLKSPASLILLYPIFAWFLSQNRDSG